MEAIVFNILQIFLQRAGNMLTNTLQFASWDARRCFLKLPFIFYQFCLIHFQSLFPCSDFPRSIQTLSHQIFYVFRISLRTSSLLISWTLHREHRWLRIILVHHGPSRIFLGPSSLFLKLSFNKCPVVLDSFPVAFFTLLAGPLAAELWRSLSFFWKQKDKSQ